MTRLLIWIARMAGTCGVALIAVAAVTRLAGAYWIGGFQMGTLLQAGIAMALVGCLAYIVVLVEQPRR